MDHSVFRREKELLALNQRLLKRKSFLLHGPAGVGKTLLVRTLASQLSDILYCGTSTSTQTVFRNIAQALLDRNQSRVKQSCTTADGIQSKSAVSLKGIVMDALRGAEYSIVLDHVERPSQSFASAIREVIGWCSTPVITIARSSHMEDTGFLQPLYSDRHDRYELKNLDTDTAQRFAQEMVGRARLSASNMKEFLTQVLELSEGNPGAMQSMLEMAKSPKYRTEGHIKIAPLYIDFRLNWLPAR